MKKKLLWLVTFALLAASSLFMGAANVFSAQAFPLEAEQTLEFKWTRDNNATDPMVNEKAVFQIFSGIWATEPQGSPYTVRTGDKLKFDVFVPVEQFSAECVGVDDAPLSVDDFAFEFFDFQREGGDWRPLGHSNRGLTDVNGSAYDRFAKLDCDEVSGGFYTRKIALDSINDFTTNFKTFVHLQASKPMKKGSTFTYYIKNIAIEDSDGVVAANVFAKTDIGGIKGNTSSEFDGVSQQGTSEDGNGQYDTSAGTEWYNKVHSLSLSAKTDFFVGKISNTTLKREYKYDAGAAGAGIDISGITATDKGGDSLVPTLKLFKADNTEVAIVDGMLLTENDYCLTALVTDLTDNSRVLTCKYKFSVIEDTKPVIDNVVLAPPDGLATKYVLPKVEAFDPLNSETKLPCTVKVVSPINQNVEVANKEQEDSFVPLIEGNYTVTYSATNSAATTVKTLTLKVEGNGNIASIGLAVPSDAQAEGQVKYASMNLYTLDDTERQLPYSTSLMLSYDVFGSGAGIGHVGIMTDTGNGSDWSKTDIRGEIVKINDKNGMSMAYDTDLTEQFSKGWYHREYDLPQADIIALGGKIMNITAVIKTDKACDETIYAYYKNIKLIDKTTQATVLDFTSRALNKSTTGDDTTEAGGNLIKAMGKSFDPAVKVNLPAAMRGIAFNKSDITFSGVGTFIVTSTELYSGKTKINDTNGKYTLGTAGKYTIKSSLSHTIGTVTYQFDLQNELVAEKYNVLPTITIVGEYGAYDKGATVTLLDCTATNPINETLEKNIVIKRGSVVIEPTDNQFVLTEYGVYTITYSAQDKDGNKSEEVITIRPKDVTAPTLTHTGLLPESVKADTELTLPVFTAADDKDTGLIVTCNIYKDGSVLEADYKAAKYTPTAAGVYEFKFSAKDLSGNESIVSSMTVTVNANSAPQPNTPEKKGCGAIAPIEFGGIAGGGIAIFLAVLFVGVLHKKKAKEN